MVQILEQLKELWGDKKEYFSFCLFDNDTITHYQKDKGFNVASSYKVYILGELLRQYEAGQFSLTETLPLTNEVRIFDSGYTENMKNGTELTILELANAMMGYSDNTATEMLQGYLGTEKILSLLSENKISETRFPQKLKLLMDRFASLTVIDEGIASSLFKGELGIVSTANDLARFYQLLWSGSIIKNNETTTMMKEILSIEDKQQKIQWPEGVSCYRKSGNMDLEYYHGFSLGGIIQNEEDYAPFALCTNFTKDESTDEMLVLFKKSFGLIKEYIISNLFVVSK